MKCVVVSFGSDGWGGSLEALRHSALCNGADAFGAYGPADVDGVLRAAGIDTGGRGYGWWAWKPWVILDALNKADDGDVVVYCDAGTLVESSLRPLAERVATALVPKLGGWSRNDYVNRRWTKRSALERLDPSGSTWDAVQVNAAFQVYRAGAAARAFVGEYLRRCLDPGIVDDSLAGPDDLAGCVDHRHDQSVLGVLSELARGTVEFMKDPTQFAVDPPHPQETHDFGTVVHHHRRKLNIPRVAVVTATIGSPHLGECLRSVQATDLPGVEHWVVIDGSQHAPAVEAAVRAAVGDGSPRTTAVPTVVTTLPRNTGAGGWCGHRVYGAVPWLVDADYVAFLDEDNFVDPSHYRDLLKACVSAGASWGHSLRRIVGPDGAPVCDDNCESLGGISHTVDGPGHYLVDTSCYMLKRELAISASPVWNARFRDPDPAKPNPDRTLCKVLLANAPHAVSRKHSVAYRVGSTDRSVRANYFLAGNRARCHDFAKFEDAYVFHFSKTATQRFLRLLAEDCAPAAPPVSRALDEWQMTLWRGLSHTHGGQYNLINGFANCPNLPAGATCLVALCNPADLPLDLFAARHDLKKLVYTLESPNARHAAQWDVGFLSRHFTMALTYYQPLLDDPRMRTAFAPHNCHHGDMDDAADRAALLRANRGTGRSCVMVLERRPQLFHAEYAVNGAPMRSLDHLREDLVLGLRDVTVFGLGWDQVADGTRVKLGGCVHRSQDPRHAVDILQDFTFAVIAENCEAEGYASEKLYDALSAGAIPLYYGCVPRQLRAAIPEGPQGVYIDLRERGITTSRQLQRLVDELSDGDIEAMKRRIVDTREDVLRLVGVRAFATVAHEAIVALRCYS